MLRKVIQKEMEIQTIVKQGTVSICDLNLILITDSAVDAVNYIRNVFGSKLENKLIQKC